ncbi:MAG: hypothetical protein Q8O56_15470 [Solirubrobacteraceae bacterium]|nr:hypothetical protein [Solirubrobacteraceae bacterium]
MTFSRNRLPVLGRSLLIAACPLVALAAFATPAAAVETPNACQFNYDSEYRTQNVEVIASAPAQATAGERFTLSGQRLDVKLRHDLASDAAQVGAIDSSPGGTISTITTRTWFALRGTNTVEGTQVIGPLTVDATTTAYSDPGGGATTATPFAYTPPKLPDTTWTSSGGPIVFSQGAAGAITAAAGTLPIGGGGSPLTVQGSAVVQADLPYSSTNFFMDCQPGLANVTRPMAGAGPTFNPLGATPFASVAVAGPPTNPDGTPPGPPNQGPGSTTTPAPPGRILSTVLVARGGKVRVRVSCPARGANCAGTVRLRTRTPYRLGTRRPKLVTMTRVVRYTVVRGRARTLTINLGLDGRSLVRQRRAYRVVLLLTPSRGKSTIRNLNLRRG